jgi:hypothetical protein
MGETWTFDNGWTLTVDAIDSKARQVWFTLSKNGKKLDEKFAVMGETYNYNNAFITKVDAIFAGPTSDMVKLTNTNYQ